MTRARVVRGARVATVAVAAWLVAAVWVIGAYTGDSVSASSSSSAPHRLETRAAHEASKTKNAELARAAATVGPLFPHGLADGHSCTASVVASTSGDVLLTAAHCLSGSAAGWLFAPGFDNGRTPGGVWTVTGAYVEPGWSSDQDQDNDVAVLTVAAKRENGRTVHVQDAVGGNPLGLAPRPDTTITDIAYNADSDAAKVCSATVYLSHGYPAFDCDGYVGGSSGSPWLAPDAQGVLTVRGVIGGPNQGGCSASTSYSSRFDSEVGALIRRADTGGRPDTVPAAGASGC